MGYPNVTYVEGPTGSFKTNAAIGLYQAVKFVAGTSSDGQALIDVAGASDRAIGIAMRPAASGGQCTIKFFSCGGTFPGVASSAITQAAAVFAAASGALAATGTVQVGFAVTAAVSGKPFIWSPWIAAA